MKSSDYHSISVFDIPHASVFDIPHVMEAGVLRILPQAGPPPPRPLPPTSLPIDHRNIEGTRVGHVTWNHSRLVTQTDRLWGCANGRRTLWLSVCESVGLT
eukprot:1022024-Amorphochlora_amoeboformis.AAC.1